MASTWSALKIELLETGANAGSWGTLTNVNLGDAVLGEAITGQATVDFPSDADVTITLTDSATTQAARNLRLNITESSSGVGSVRNLILGSGCQIEKFYLINNTGTGAKTVKNTSGTGISVPAGKATLVYNNGTNVVDAASYFTSLTLGSPLPIASGGTATATPALVQGTGVTITGTWPNQTINATGTGGTVTSVAVSGGTTGLTTSGGPITTSGTVTLAGTVATTNGGTGLTSFTSGGVPYATSTSALTTGSALTFNGSALSVTGTITAAGQLATILSTNSALQIATSNSNAGALADNNVIAGNGTNNAIMAMKGTGFTTSGIFSANNAYFGGTGTSSTNLYSTSGNVNIYPASTLVATFTTTGLAVTGVITSTNYGTFRNLRIGTDGGNDIYSSASANIYYSTSGNSYAHSFGNASASTYCQLSYTAQTFFSSNVERARVQTGFSVGTTSDPGAGAIYATGAITAFFSDKRLKTVSGKIENALDKVAQLSGVYYTFNDTAKSFGYDSDEEHVGVIAQEVEAVLPQIVKAAPFDLDENNNSKSGQNYKTVQYEKLTPLLIEAINELQAKVKLLENK